MPKLSLAKQTYIKHLAVAGDLLAASVAAVANDVTLSASAKVTNTITVTGQLIDGTGAPMRVATDVLLTSKPAVGAGTMTVTTGTLVAGSASTSLWLTSTSTGSFSVGVLNATASDPNLVTVQTADGVVGMIKLVFT